MNRSLISSRYAKALFKLAVEQGNLEQVNNDIALLQSYCKEAEGFADLLESPVVKPEQKKKALHTVLEKKIETSTMAFLDLLISNNREVLLEDINRVFIQLYKQSKGIKSVVLYTAVEMEQYQVDNLVDFLGKQLDAPIELNLKVDPELLGGFKLTIDGKMVDASLSTKLNKMKKQLLS